MAKQIRDLEAELDEERKQRQTAVNAKKKLETDYKDLESTMDMNNKLKEDALKQLKKLQQAMKVRTALKKRIKDVKTKSRNEIILHFLTTTEIVVILFMPIVNHFYNFRREVSSADLFGSTSFSF